MGATPPDRARILARYKDTLDLTWCHGGREVLLLRGQDRDSECAVERVSWPELHSLDCSDAVPADACVGLFAAAEKPVAVVIGADQSGYSTIDILNLDSMEFALTPKYYCRETIASVAFSPGDRLFVAVGVPFLEEDPFDPGPDATTAVVGTAVIATVGAWDYLEAPILVSSHEEFQWPRLDDFLPCAFLDDRHLTVEVTAGHPLVLDVEAMRTDPRWLDARARKRQEAKALREEDEARIRSIRDHNLRAAAIARDLEAVGLVCPFCRRHGQDIRYHPGTASERALFLCPGCGRSFGPDSG